MKSSMPLPEPTLNILLINERPDEIKLVTSSLRGFFSGCRIEAGYSSEEALLFSQQNEWHIILLDQDLAPERGLDILARLRRNAPYAAILLQTNDSDSHTAVQALQNGADFLLFKRSPGFVSELLFSVQEAVEKRDLQMKLDHTFQRHQRVIETLSDLVYELDREGRFVYVGASVTAVLGYTPEELAGQHYSILLPPLQESSGRFRLNERRAGNRSVRRLELTLYRKSASDEPPTPIAVEITAKGLFNSTHRYLGTVGILRDLSQQKAQQDRLAELESRLQESNRQLTLSREAALVSRQLQQPLTTLLQDSQRLLSSIQDSKIEQHVETMVERASRANQLGHQLVQAIHAPPLQFAPLALNDIIQMALHTIRQEPEGAEVLVTTRFAEHLPRIQGAADALEHLVRILLGYAHRQATDSGTPPTLLLETAPLPAPERGAMARHTPPDSSVPQSYASFTIRGTSGHRLGASREQLDSPTSPEEFFRAHQIVQAHGGAIEIEHAPEGGMTITVRIPASTDLAYAASTDQAPESSIVTIPHRTRSTTHTPAQPPAQHQSDRRRSERKLFSLPVQLSIGGTALRGLLRNISTGGALLTVHDLAPSIHLQPAYVVIKTPVSFLELQGVVHERPTTPADLPFQAITHFVIAFSPGSERDRNVLRSLLEGLQDGSTVVTFEGLILPLSSPTDRHPADGLPSTTSPADRREAIRLHVPCLIRPAGTSTRPPWLALNLSLDGACIELPDDSEPSKIHQIIHLVLIEPNTPSPIDSQLEGSEEPWPARIVWTRRPPTRPTGSPMLPETVRCRLGIRFEELSPAQEHRLRSLLAPRIRAPQDLAESVTHSPVRTTTHTVRNPAGLTIALSHDVPSHTHSEPPPLMLLCPGYGVTQQAFVGFAYALVASGVQVIRYDHSRHIGLSGGDAAQTTLTSLEDDLDAVLSFAQKECPGASITILAHDLLGRITLRRQDWHRRIRRLLLLNPTLDLQHCLTSLHQRDILQEHLAGVRLGLGNLLGIPLDIDHFLADAVAAHYTDLKALQEDLTHCETDVVLLTAGPGTADSQIPNPTPALLDDVLHRLGARGSRVLLSSPLLTADTVTPTARHATWQRIAQLCSKPDTFAHPPSTLAAHDLSRATSVRVRFERDQLRIKYATGIGGRERLWAAHIDLTRTLDELPAHWQYVDQLYQLLQPLDGGLTLLDVGCGMHSFSRLLLLNLSYRLRAHTWHHNQPLHYVGMDVSFAALQDAQSATHDALTHVDQLFSGRISGPTPVTQQWVLGRSLETLPFADQSFDRIVANLSLTFSRSPLHALRELFRVLRPGGKLVISALTPFADLAALYRPALQEQGVDAFTGEARLILNRMAQSCVALRVGQLHAFQEEALSARLSQLTTIPPRLVRTFSGQILLAVAEKPDSAG